MQIIIVFAYAHQGGPIRRRIGRNSILQYNEMINLCLNLSNEMSPTLLLIEGGKALSPLPTDGAYCRSLYAKISRFKTLNCVAKNHERTLGMFSTSRLKRPGDPLSVTDGESKPAC